VNRIIFLVSVFLCVSITYTFAAGRSDEQSQALLYRQKRTTWEGAPEGSAFYECYLVNYGDKGGPNGQAEVLLDAFMRAGFLQSPVLIVNPATSMTLEASNGDQYLKKQYTPYKCIVLYTASIVGCAIVTIFKADPLNIKIGYVFSNSGYDFPFKFVPPYEDMDYDAYQNNDDDSNLFVVFPNETKLLQINQWPNPTEFNEVDGYRLLEESYNTFISENTGISDSDKQKLKTQYEAQRRSIQERLNSISEDVWRNRKLE